MRLLIRTSVLSTPDGKGTKVMGMPNRDEVKGKYEAAKGSVKETVGQVIDDKEMEREGAAERGAGDARHQVGKIKRKVGEAIEDIGKFVGK